ncbi:MULTISPECIES: xanthine dehydrogenase family protein molybdopterin-binding subunit [Methylobacterium]|uniref:xanthine dehydrogenase family protein molybdopterin-binding subunit n=1 Tax=Methylobacterium TaxID=407 RepID=UPI0005E641AE|nr:MULTISPECIES: xanthine dehydrogenase family protein molybdopterin-binding subunit [Methylobacterium]MBN6822564.1 xanthine dehydrogenase family protein molybdopterin-binding subunit [Methylobacterium organophilum]OXE41270.1 twin-arginine translocation pathway signal protein [Methylobacterium radiotolerans]UIY43874.1 xanthine dehydrogenase family protein molybdopterin-binding subunit [Methylobacterium radiotolerans]GAN49920.1 molybdopterin binding aldehyde oxidase and xanthine dehydrogenase [M
MLNARRPSPLPARPSRRGLLAGAGALVVAFRLDPKPARAAPGPNLADVKAQPNAFVRIGADDTVTVVIKHLDMGQGNTTGLATILADELGADWAKVRTEFAPADAALYNNTLMGPIQGTGGSTAVANSWFQLRKAGAAAREMLTAEAAFRWKVPVAEITVADHLVRHAPSGRQARFGELAASAASLPVPSEPRLKDPSEWTLIGQKVPRLDSVAKTNGTAVYSLDIRRPNQVKAVVARAPRFGATVKSFDAAAARKVAGVLDVVQVPTGVAVIARDTWSAMKGREALTVAWDDSTAETRSSDAILAEYRERAKSPGLTASERGDPQAALKGAAKVVEAEFTFPYLAHAAMEPLNATIERAADGGYDVYAGFQFQTVEQATMAAILGVTPDRVRLHSNWAGGSFGRRATPTADYLAEAATVLKASGEKAPVHLVWTREDDMAGGYYRPTVLHRVRAGIDGKGAVVGWDHVMVGKSIMIGSPFEAMIVKNGVDSTTVEGASDTAYALPAYRFGVHNGREGVPVLWWRSVGHTHTAHVMEVMIDELAHAANVDPVAYRLSLLTQAPRLSGVLKLAAEKAGWSAKPQEQGRGLGVAVHESFGSYVAMVADVTARDAAIRVNRIVAAVDVGVPVNPDVIRAQVEGAVGFALSAVLRNRITLKEGHVQEHNFDAYEPTRMSEMPKVEVHIVPSQVAPTGIGEPGVPVLGPSIANAVFAATGRRVRSLPLDLSGVKGA